MKYKLEILGIDNESDVELYYELNEDLDQLKAIANQYTKDEQFNKKIIESYFLSEIRVSIEEMNEDGTWTTILSFIDFL